MNIDDFITYYLSAIGSPTESFIAPNTNFKDLEEWDSVLVLNLIAMIDEEYDVIISFEEIDDCKSIQELFELIAKRSNL